MIVLLFLPLHDHYRTCYHCLHHTPPSLPQPLPLLGHHMIVTTSSITISVCNARVCMYVYVHGYVYVYVYVQGLRWARFLRVAQCAAFGSSGWLRCARSSGVIRSAALRAVFRGHRRSCAVRGSGGLRSARASAGHEVAPGAASGRRNHNSRQS